MPSDLPGAGPFRQHLFLPPSTSAPIGPRSYFSHLKISSPPLLPHTFFSSPFHSHLPEDGPHLLVRFLATPSVLLALPGSLPTFHGHSTAPLWPNLATSCPPWLPGGPFPLSSSRDACTSPDSVLGLCFDVLLPLPGLLPPCSVLRTKNWTPYLHGRLVLL